MQYPVYQGPAFVGWMDEEDCRDILRNREGRLVRRGNERKVILNTSATPRTRALCNTSTRSAMSPTQREELYQGFRKDHSDGPVTKVLTVVRKVGKDRELVNWGETERFRRGRWNPDRIPPALYRSEAHYRQANG